MSKPIILFSCLFQTLFISRALSQNIELNPLFSDHTVLQQKTKAAIWGNTAPNTEILIIGSWGKKAKTISDKNGNWKTNIKTPKAGGPYQIIISNKKEKKTINDVMIGEVWLCSGQSNMQMSLKGNMKNEPIEGSEEAIRSADFPKIRMFTVKQHLAITPQQNMEGAWSVCSPETAGDFSAAAFFFGRKLHQTLNVPVGLIHSSWGGTPAEAWTSVDYLQTLPDFKTITAEIKTFQEETEQLNKWLNEKEQIEEDTSLGDERFKHLDFGDGLLAAENYNDEDWQIMNVPKSWERTEIKEFDGVIWFRKKINIPADWNEKNMILELSPVDDMDRTFINGQLIGATEKHGFWQLKRAYPFPGNILQKGENTIAIRVLDTGGGGGFHGDAADMRIFPKGEENEAINLSGDWKCLPVAEYKWNKFFLFGNTVADFEERPKPDLSLGSKTPTVLYNGMIAPLIPYSIKGAIWYQGENNASRAEQYKILFPTMIKSWRNKWEKEFPFYFTQIAPFKYSGANNSESAELRFAQNQTLTLPKTGQAVTLDIGSLETIHPPKKKDVGERLARWALAKDYKQKSVACSGPVCVGAKLTGDKIILEFNIGAKALVAGESGLKEFELVFADGLEKETAASIQGNKIILDNKSGNKPMAVRYAWRNGSEASLFNSAGLPASTFYLEVK